jgi:ribosome modulation factor
MNHLIEANAANELARTRGYFARVSGGGRVLAFYTGDELQPGTWLEAGRTGMTDNGFISRNAFEMICRERRTTTGESR